MTAITEQIPTPDGSRRIGKAGGTAGTSRSMIRLYTDGACVWPHGPGGAAAVYIDGDNPWQQRVWGIASCTNNRAELIAIIEGLGHVPTSCEVVVHTDSQYVLDCIHHLAKWAKSGWQNRGRRKTTRIANSDLLKRLHRVLKRRKVRFEKVAAHCGVPGNELADHVAYLAALYMDRSSSGAGHQDLIYICSCTGDEVPMSLSGLDEIAPTPPVEPLYIDNRYLPRVKRHPERRASSSIYGSGRGARFSPADVHDPWEIKVDAHQGSHRDYLWRYVRTARAAAGQLSSQTPSREARTFVSELFKLTTDFRMLRCAYDLTAQSGSIASGVDGMTIDDYAYDHTLLIHTLKELETTLRAGTYRPRRLRRVHIPKPGNRGMRPIDIPTIEDRIVDRGLLLTLAPLLEPKWHDCNVGFRQGHGVQDGLTMVEWHVRKGDRTVALTVDIHKAFTNVPKCRLIHAITKSLPTGTPKQLTTLVGNIIRRPLPAGEHIRKDRGIPQGSPLSPLLLNIYLNRHLDQQWDHERWPMVRYADDIIILAASRLESDTALRTLTHLLRPNGLNLREETPAPAELTCGDLATWLGFTLSWDGARLRFDLDESSWDRLHDGLIYALSVDVPARSVTSQVLTGWLDFAGPTYRPGLRYTSYRREFVDRVASMLANVGKVDDGRLPSRVIHHMWRTAASRYRRRRRRLQDRLRIQEKLERTFRQFTPITEETMTTW